MEGAAWKTWRQAENVIQGKHHLSIGKMKASGGGNNQEYLLRCLARDHKDIFAAYERDEYPSVRQAAIAPATA